jgi:transposase
MRQIREVLRLRFASELPQRGIAKSLGLSQAAVSGYLSRARAAGVSWPLPADLDDEQLEALLFPAPPAIAADQRPMPDWAWVHRELRRPNVTLALLWEEYRAGAPDGFGYSWFCDLYRGWAGRLKPTMRQTHLAGEKLFVDFAGRTGEVVDGLTGEIIPVQIFVAVLGASSFTYAEAGWSQKLPDWIAAHVRAFAYFGGVARQTVSDNLKAGITKACFHEPMINRTYADMARHYGTAIVPARPYKPRDKATASYCTSFGDLHGDGNEPSWVRRFSAAAPQDGLVGRQLPEATLQLVLVELRDQSLAAPLLDGGFGDAEAGGDLPSGQHAEAAQPLIPAGQLIGGADEGDLLQIEGLRFPSPAAALVEDVGDLAIAVPVEEPIDLGDELGLELADLRNRQRPFEPQAASGAATQADMGSDHLGLDQGHVLDEQAQDPLAVARLDARIVPNRRELFG